VELLLGDADKAWMAMTGSQDGNPGVHIEKTVSVNVPHFTTLGVIDDQRVHPSQWSNNFIVTGDNGLRTWARHCFRHVIARQPRRIRLSRH
jgi:hypothetical protein